MFIILAKYIDIYIHNIHIYIYTYTYIQIYIHIYYIYNIYSNFLYIISFIVRFSNKFFPFMSLY